MKLETGAPGTRFPLARVWREPLVHFLLLGAAMFVVGWLRGGDPSAEARRIVVTPERAQQLAQVFARTWQRPPTRAELDALVDDYIKEEIYYRQGRAMGLDQDDTVIRRRLRQKLEFLTEDAAATVPGDAELESFLAEHRGDYDFPPRLALRQIYFSIDRRGERARADAEALLERLPPGRWPHHGDELGDPLLLELPLEPLAPTEISRLMGERFAAAAAELPVGRWSGPVESGFGLHLVLVTQRLEGRAATLGEVRQQVERDWLAARRERAEQQLYLELLRHYEVVRMDREGEEGR